MTNTSATGGYLAPDGILTPPLEDDGLVDFMGDVVAGVTGLDRDANVRPRWQKEPPDLPAFGTDWVAVGIPETDRDTFGYNHHVDTAAGGQGADQLQRHERFRLACSFYGPNAGKLAAVLNDGLMIAQNREQLFLASMAVQSTGSPQRSPELIKNQWTSRVDVDVWISRQIIREYPVLNLRSAQATLQTDAVTDTINATP